MDCVPAYKPIDVHDCLKNIAIETAHDELYSRLTEYNVSLLKKCMRIYNHTVLVAHDFRINSIQSRFDDPDVREFDEIFSRNFENQSEFPGMQEPFES